MLLITVACNSCKFSALFFLLFEHDIPIGGGKFGGGNLIRFINFIFFLGIDSIFFQITYLYLKKIESIPKKIKSIIWIVTVRKKEKYL